MSRSTRLVGFTALATLAVGVAILETVAGKRFSDRLARAVTRTARYETGVLKGFRYRIAGRHPDPGVEDQMLADRVRSTLGPLEHHMDVPRVHVQAQGHSVLLHGDVGSEKQVKAIVEAVSAISGVHEVQSHLRVGFIPGETRPSEAKKSKKKLTTPRVLSPS